MVRYNKNLVLYVVIMSMDDGNTEHTFRCNHDDGQVMLGRLYILYDDWTHIYEEKSGKYVQKLVTLTEI